MNDINGLRRGMYRNMPITVEVGFKRVPEIAGAHHEKFDGTGYPKGLKGSDIPLGARIIAVADFFDAITSRRHYRNPMPFAEAIRMVERERVESILIRL